MKKRIILLLILFIVMQSVRATEHRNELWLAGDTQNQINEKWLYGLYSQLRVVNQSHPLEDIILEARIGYQITDNKSAWLGYRWTGHDPNNGFYQDNRLFQQIIWQINQNSNQKLASRTRLEEIKRSNQSQMSYRARERISIALLESNLKTINPYFYDEVFFQLNRTNYSAQQLFSENRLFVGMNVKTTRNAYWEIGYINQYKVRTETSQNQVNHILSITYNYK